MPRNIPSPNDSSPSRGMTPMWPNLKSWRSGASRYRQPLFTNGEMGAASLPTTWKCWPATLESPRLSYSLERSRPRPPVELRCPYISAAMSGGVPLPRPVEFQFESQPARVKRSRLRNITTRGSLTSGGNPNWGRNLTDFGRKPRLVGWSKSSIRSLWRQMPCGLSGSTRILSARG